MRSDLQTLRRTEAEALYDMHGNACQALQNLMVERFAATQSITSEVERVELEPGRESLARALVDVLGFVKDPASVEWLRTHDAWRRTDKRFETWTWRWRNRFEGYGDWPWLEGRERWLDFFIGEYRRESREARRLVYLEVLSGFDDDRVQKFFRQTETGTSAPRESLAIQAYFAARALPTDPRRIRVALDALSPDSANDTFLVEMANVVRDAAFLSFLIDRADRLEGAHRALQAITFELEVKGRDGWRRWAEQNGRLTRKEWRAGAEAKFDALLQRDTRAAAKFLETAVYTWNDITLLPFLEREALPRPEFRDHLAGWLNLTYRPGFRSHLAPLAERLARDAQSLSPWARDLLIAGGFLPGPATSWREYVERENSAV